MRFVLPLIAAFALSLSGVSAQAGLFGGCGWGCAPVCCDAAPVCCEPAPVVECCDPCAPKCHGRLLHKLFHKHNDCGCDAAPVCCEPAPAPAPCCEPAPVDCCDPCAPRHSHLKAMLAKVKARHAARHACCEPACDACEPSCGVEAAAPCCGN